MDYETERKDTNFFFNGEKTLYWRWAGKGGGGAELKYEEVFRLVEIRLFLRKEGNFLKFLNLKNQNKTFELQSDASRQE
jgi:hypothetical protein